MIVVVSLRLLKLRQWLEPLELLELPLVNVFVQVALLHLTIRVVNAPFTPWFVLQLGEVVLWSGQIGRLATWGRLFTIILCYLEQTCHTLFTQVVLLSAGAFLFFLHRIFCLSSGKSFHSIIELTSLLHIWNTWQVVLECWQLLRTVHLLLGGQISFDLFFFQRSLWHCIDFIAVIVSDVLNAMERGFLFYLMACIKRAWSSWATALFWAVMSLIFEGLSVDENRRICVGPALKTHWSPRYNTLCLRRLPF